MTPISDTEKGKQAYINGDGHLYLTGAEEFQEGYRDEWYRNQSRVVREDPSGHLEEVAWDQHYEHEIACYERIDTADLTFAPTVRHKSISGTEAMMLLNFIGTFLLGMATTAVLVLLFLAPFLMSADEVIAFWRGL